MERLAPYIRRRLDFDTLKNDMDNIIEYELIICDFSDASDFVSEACDLLAYRYIEDYNIPQGKESDSLYSFLVDLFGEYLVSIHNHLCEN